MHIVIFAGGTLRPGRAVDAAIAQADLVIAADSGTSAALRYGLIPTFVVGDFDSINAQELAYLKARGSHIIQANAEKDETDTELAVQTALAQGATSITLLGALGGTRFDHTMANILLLAAFETTPISIIDGPSSAWLLRGPGRTTIAGQKSDLLSLLPLTGAANGVRTTGLYYPLQGETLYFGRPRGVSNVLVQEEVEVSLAEGLLLIIHTAAQEL